MWAGGQRHVPAALSPGVTRYPFYRWWVGPRAGAENLISPGFVPQAVQPVASRYTD
jgi:hypothetical protein